jgi:methylated-DNA-[protein]-cysteine S-methyltransferase
MQICTKNGIDIFYSKLLGLYIEVEYNTALRSLRFLNPGEKLKEKKTLDVTFELERYFEAEVIEFSSDLDMSHLSPFEQKVLEETRNIKYGRTITYSQLAEKLECGGARAVGNALGKNPIPIIIPCHRVVAKKGIGGYSAGIDIKTRLLEFEKLNANNL